MANTTVKAPRITKAMRFEDIKALLNGQAVKHNTTVEDACKFIDSEMALLAKKNSSDKKPTKTQEENKVFKTKILDWLAQQTEGKTCTEIWKGVPEFADFNNQKIAALVRQLVEDGKVEKATVKGKSLFTLAVSADE